MEKSLGVHADARGSYGAYNGSASFDFSKSMQANDYQSVLIYRIDVNTGKFTGQAPVPLYDAGGMEWGLFGAPALCPEGTAVCGYDLQVEQYQDDGDDTGMNDMAVACCVLP